MFDLIQHTDFESIEICQKVNKIENKSETLRVNNMLSLRCFAHQLLYNNLVLDNRI